MHKFCPANPILLRLSRERGCGKAQPQYLRQAGCLRFTRRLSPFTLNL